MRQEKFIVLKIAIGMMSFTLSSFAFYYLAFHSVQMPNASKQLLFVGGTLLSFVISLCSYLLYSIHEKKRLLERKHSELKEVVRSKNLVNKILTTALAPISIEEKMQRCLQAIIELLPNYSTPNGVIFFHQDDRLLVKSKMTSNTMLAQLFAHKDFQNELKEQLLAQRTLLENFYSDPALEQFHLVAFPIITGKGVLGCTLLSFDKNFQLNLDEITTLSLTSNLIAGIIQKEQVESELEHQRLKSAQSAKMAAIGEMSGGIAHEINNPLAIISVSTQRILKEFEVPGGPDQDKLFSLARTIENTINRIAKIVKGLRQFSRSENGEYQKQLVSLSAIIDDTLSLCSEKLRTEGVKLKIEIDEVLVPCNSVQIVQVLLNLLINARDIAVETPEKWILIKSQVFNNRLKIRVIDPGHGIPLEIQEKIFLPFFTTKPVGVGTGLGISISKGIAQEHGGALEYELYEGHTCFCLDLPLRTQEIKKAAS